MILPYKWNNIRMYYYMCNFDFVLYTFIHLLFYYSAASLLRAYYLIIFIAIHWHHPLHLICFTLRLEYFRCNTKKKNVSFFFVCQINHNHKHKCDVMKLIKIIIHRYPVLSLFFVVVFIFVNLIVLFISRCANCLPFPLCSHFFFFCCVYVEEICQSFLLYVESKIP